MNNNYRVYQSNGDILSSIVADEVTIINGEYLTFLEYMGDGDKGAIAQFRVKEIAGWELIK